MRPRTAEWAPIDPRLTRLGPAFRFPPEVRPEPTILQSPGLTLQFGLPARAGFSAVFQPCRLHTGQEDTENIERHAASTTRSPNPMAREGFPDGGELVGKTVDILALRCIPW
jgi:hypothetical protein